MSTENTNGPRPRPKIISSKALLEATIPEPPFLIGDWFAEGAPILISAPTKCGKSWFGYTLIHHLALNHNVFGWNVIEKRLNVAIVDAEMRPHTIKKRLKILREMTNGEAGNIQIIARESYTEQGMLFPDLTNIHEVKRMLDELGNLDVILFDNINSLFPVEMKLPEFWHPVERLLLECKRRKITPILIHHNSKSNSSSPSGSSKAERIPEVVIVLERISREAGKQAHFNVRFRHLRDMADTAQDFSAELFTDGTTIPLWVIRDAVPMEETYTDSKVTAHELRKRGLTVRQIAGQLGRGKSTVHDWLKEDSCPEDSDVVRPDI